MGVSPKGRGQDARVNRMDARERRSDYDVEKAMDGFFNKLLHQDFAAKVRLLFRRSRYDTGLYFCSQSIR